ncbi:MAG TPA: hypothetical protein VFQ59_00430 [Candidatus Paceibacterota bacterium]|nr:hypothetical protein [Candidatus Paceibacterota bacterium]
MMEGKGEFTYREKKEIRETLTKALSNFIILFENAVDNYGLDKIEIQKAVEQLNMKEMTKQLYAKGNRKEEVSQIAEEYNALVKRILSNEFNALAENVQEIRKKLRELFLEAKKL